MKITTTRLKQISYEDTYAYCILGFERLQARTKGPNGKPLRPPLPCDRGEKRSRTDTGAFTPILRVLEKHGPMTSKDIARLLKKNSHNVCGTIRHAVDAGLVVKKAHVRSRNGGKGHMNCWLYHISA